MNELKKKIVWDPVTRVWHWVLVFTVVVGWGLGEFMDFDTVTWHFYTGYLILGLMVFRVVWGLIGPAPIRFINLLPTPSAFSEYIRTIPERSPSGTPGHNPLGSLWILAILVLLTAQGTTGLFIEEEDLYENGPLFDYVSIETSDMLNGWHYYLSNIILGMVILHVSVILFYLFWKKENLIKPMINGWKWVKNNRNL